MASTKINLLMEQGATFHFEAALKDADEQPLSVVTFTARSQMRMSFESETAYEFVVTISEGLVVLDMTAANTGLIPPGRYVYDVYFYETDNTLRILEGNVIVTPQTTK